MTHRYTDLFIPLSYHTLSMLTVFFMLGIYIQSVSLWAYAFIVFAVTSASLLLVLTHYYARYQVLAYCALFFSAGLWSYAHKIGHYQATQQVTLGTGGTLSALVTHLTPTARKNRYAATLSLHNVTNEQQETILTTGTILLHCTQRPHFSAGDNVAIPRNLVKLPGSESFRQYCMKENVLGVIFNPPRNTITLQTTSKTSWLAWLYRQRQLLLERIAAKLSRNTFALFSSLFLGERHALERDCTHLKHQFRYWGISHYLARSGLHMIIFLVLWATLLRCIPCNRLLKLLCTLALALVYYLFSYTSVSFNRAFVVFILCTLCDAAGYRRHALHILTLTTLLVLLLNPLQLFSLDFQLSFCLATLLAWLTQLR